MNDDELAFYEPDEPSSVLDHPDADTAPLGDVQRPVKPCGQLSRNVYQLVEVAGGIELRQVRCNEPANHPSGGHKFTVTW